MTQTNRGKVALVTGGAKRVGRAVALQLAEHGFDVAITYRESEAEAQQVVREIRKKRRSGLAIEADLASPEAPEQVREAFAARFGRLDALIHNAAIFGPTGLGEMDAATYDRYQAINARAPLLLTQAFADWLGAHHDPADPHSAGRIVSFTDTHLQGRPRCGYAAYAASKAALQEITETLAVELAPAVTVNAIAPGVVAWASDYDAPAKAQYLQHVPLGRAGTVEDTAAAALFLVSDAPYITGQTLRIDGGRWLK
jgi:pteridine reductase